MSYLRCSAPPELKSDDIPCVALAHNEGAILQEFLSHYRTLGVTRFLIVNDRSKDETGTILEQASDVTVFTPRDGSTYKEHKRFWRAELLDEYGSDRWCVVPDVDEHLMFSGMPDRNLRDVVKDLEREGADAVLATMVDMYSEAPLADTKYKDEPLADAFPLFDNASHHFRILAPGRFRKKYPTPAHFVLGGMRQRMFMPLHIYGNGWRESHFRRLSSVKGGTAFQGGSGVGMHLARALIKSRLKGQYLFNQSKVPLVRWRKGLYFYNGAHALSQPMKLSQEQMALLHFCFAIGIAGFEYKAARREHTNGAAFYQRILESEAAQRSSPVFDGTASLHSPDPLKGFFS